MEKLIQREAFVLAGILSVFLIFVSIPYLSGAPIEARGFIAFGAMLFAIMVVGGVVFGIAGAMALYVMAMFVTLGWGMMLFSGAYMFSTVTFLLLCSPIIGVMCIEGIKWRALPRFAVLSSVGLTTIITCTVMGTITYLSF
ncbi:MAG: hypothetical protein ACKKL6_03820 [Candidatus Komeilibacteria bacterium]